jgi:hypothetical protein
MAVIDKKSSVSTFGGGRRISFGYLIELKRKKYIYME